MIKKKIRKDAIVKRHRRVRLKISGCAERPRLAVYKSNAHIYAQLIDDERGITLAAASTLEKEMREKFPSGANVESAKEVGKLIAERAKNVGVEVVVFDRGGFIYHGQVANVAEGAREAGLFF